MPLAARCLQVEGELKARAKMISTTEEIAQVRPAV